MTPKTKEQDSTALVAFMAMRILTDDVHLLVRQGIVSESKPVDKAFSTALSSDETET